MDQVAWSDVRVDLYPHTYDTRFDVSARLTCDACSSLASAPLSPPLASSCLTHLLHFTGTFI
jgi:hypothetical protein